MADGSPSRLPNPIQPINHHQYRPVRQVPESLRKRDLHDLWQDSLELEHLRTRLRSERDRTAALRSSDKEVIDKLREQLAAAEKRGDIEEARASDAREQKAELGKDLMAALALKHTTQGKYIELEKEYQLLQVRNAELHEKLQARNTALHEELLNTRIHMARLQEREQHSSLLTYVEACQRHMADNTRMTDQEKESMGRLFSDLKIPPSQHEHTPPL